MGFLGFGKVHVYGKRIQGIRHQVGNPQRIGCQIEYTKITKLRVGEVPVRETRKRPRL